MVEPEIYEFLDWMTDVADSFGLVVLPEVHDRYATHERLSAHGYWTYDFVLPGLAAPRLRDRPDATRLAEHLATIAGPAVHEPRLPRRHPGPPGSRRDPDAGRDGRPGRAGPAPGRERQPHPVRRPRRRRATCISSTAPTTRRSAATTSATSPPARSSCSRAGFRRSTTSACWPARTTTPRWSERARAARSTATTTPRDEIAGGARSIGRQAGRRPGPPPEHAPGVRGRAPGRGRRRPVDPTPVAACESRPDPRCRLRRWPGRRDRRGPRRVPLALGDLTGNQRRLRAPRRRIPSSSRSPSASARPSTRSRDCRGATRMPRGDCALPTAALVARRFAPGTGADARRVAANMTVAAGSGDPGARSADHRDRWDAVADHEPCGGGRRRRLARHGRPGSNAGGRHGEAAAAADGDRPIRSHPAGTDPGRRSAATQLACRGGPGDRRIRLEPATARDGLRPWRLCPDQRHRRWRRRRQPHSSTSSTRTLAILSRTWPGGAGWFATTIPTRGEPPGRPSAPSRASIPWRTAGRSMPSWWWSSPGEPPRRRRSIVAIAGWPEPPRRRPGDRDRRRAAPVIRSREIRDRLGPLREDARCGRPGLRRRAGDRRPR